MSDKLQAEAFFKRYKLPEILARLNRMHDGWQLSSLPGTALAEHRVDMYRFAAALQVLIRELYEGEEGAALERGSDVVHST